MKNKNLKKTLLKKVIGSEVCSLQWEFSEYFIHLRCTGDVSQETKIIFDFPIMFLKQGAYDIEKELKKSITFNEEVFTFVEQEILELLPDENMNI